jgi:hypothetical protein
MQSTALRAYRSASDDLSAVDLSSGSKVPATPWDMQAESAGGKGSQSLVVTGLCAF